MEYKNYYNIFIKSEKRTRGTATDFEIDLTQPIKEIKGAEIINFVCPLVHYVIKIGVNNVIKFEDNIPNTYTANLLEGNYTSTQFAIEVQRALNAAFAGFSVVYNSNTYKLIISNAAQFKILSNITDAQSTAYILIGSPNEVLGVSVTSQYVIDRLNNGKFLLLSIAELGGHITFLPDANNNLSFGKTISAFIPVSLIMGSNQVLFLSDKIELPIHKNFHDMDKISVKLYDDDGTLLNLNGANFSFVLRLFI